MAGSHGGPGSPLPAYLRSALDHRQYDVSSAPRAACSRFLHPPRLYRSSVPSFDYLRCCCSYVKLNTLHVHVVDCDSWPLQVQYALEPAGACARRVLRDNRQEAGTERFTAWLWLVHLGVPVQVTTWPDLWTAAFSPRERYSVMELQVQYYRVLSCITQAERALSVYCGVAEDTTVLRDRRSLCWRVCRRSLNTAEHAV
jgi:hypothetical protein